MGDLTHHRQDQMPTEALDQLLEIYEGERVFHNANWGGYLTWHGWDLNPRFQTWIDDRMDVHGQQHSEEYFEILRAAPGWQQRLDSYDVELICIPEEWPLAREAEASPVWREILRHQHPEAPRESGFQQETNLFQFPVQARGREWSVCEQHPFPINRPVDPARCNRSPVLPGQFVKTEPYRRID